jgi:hypothetical protein
MKISIPFLLLCIVSMATIGCRTTSSSKAQSLDTPLKLHIPLMYKYNDKLVYTIEKDVNEKDLKLDCESWSGQFNKCGSVCDDLKNKVKCIDVCAYTCDHIEQEEG